MKRVALRRFTAGVGASAALVAGFVVAPLGVTAAQADGFWDDDYQDYSFTSQFPTNPSGAAARMPADIPVLRATVPNITDKPTIGSPQREDWNYPAIFYAYVEAGETVSARFGGRAAGHNYGDSTVYPYNTTFDSAGTSGANNKYYYGAAFAYWTIVNPDLSVRETNDTLTTPDRVIVNSSARGALRYERTGGAWFNPTDNTGEHQPTDFTATETGVYAFAVRSSNYLAANGKNTDASQGFPWQITVSEGGTEIPGRVWTDDLGVSDNGMISMGDDNDFDTYGMSMKFVVIAETGYQYEYRVDGIVNYNTRIRASAFGIADSNCDSIDGSVRVPNAPASNCTDGLYRIFFDEPAADLPETADVPRLADNRSGWSLETGEWVLPTIDDNPEGQITAFTPDNPSATDYAGTLDYTWNNFLGQASLRIDANGNGSYTDPVDVSLPVIASTLSGSGSVDFDGNDALGNPIAAGTTASAKFTVTRYPQLHVTLQDPEQVRTGIALTRLNGTGDEVAGGDRVFWDDSALLTDNTTCSSPYPGSDPTDTSNPLSTKNLAGDQVGLVSSTDPTAPTFTHKFTSSTTGPWPTCQGNRSLTDNASWGENALIDHWASAEVNVSSTVTWLRDAPAPDPDPALSVVKRGDGKLAPTKQEAVTVTAGSNVEFTYVVTNDGKETLTDVTLDDDQIGAVTETYDENGCIDSSSWTGTLEPGECIGMIASGPVPEGDYLNIATASGEYDDGSAPDTAADSAGDDAPEVAAATLTDTARWYGTGVAEGGTGTDPVGERMPNTGSNNLQGAASLAALLALLGLASGALAIRRRIAR